MILSNRRVTSSYTWGGFSRDEFLTRYPDSQNAVIPHHIYQYTYKEDISVERARQYLNLSQDAFIVTAFRKISQS